jgi:flagellar export protein FliJ
MAYRFRLETVMRVRKLSEQRARQDLAAAVRSRRAAEEDLERSLAWCAALQQGSGVCSVQDFRYEREAAERAGRSLSAAGASLRGALELCEERTAVWQAARGRVRMLERLDERRHAEYELDQARREAKVLDELAAIRWLRARAEHPAGLGSQARHEEGASVG